MSSKKLLYSSALLLIVAAIVLINDVKCEPAKPQKFCRERAKLNVSGDLGDEYLLVDAEVDAMLVLECKFCEDPNEEMLLRPKIWHWQDLNRTSEPTEVKLGMENNASLNRILLTVGGALVVRVFSPGDAGFYSCLGANRKKFDREYHHYRLEPVFKNETLEPAMEGDETDYKKYREQHLVPVTSKFSSSEDTELVKIRKEGVTLEVTSEWRRWSHCKECKANRGVRKKKALCRIASYLYENAESGNKTSEIIDFFANFPLIPCRSIILGELFPNVSNATRYLPEFVVTEPCKPCKKVKKKKNKFKYKRRYVLKEGAHLSITCPESTEESNVVWEKDSKVLEKGKGHSFRKKDPQPRVLVDIFMTIYLKGISKYEQGSYTCTVDDIRMMQAKVIVVTETKLLTQAFVRHFYFLSFVLLLALVGYCYGVFKACKNRRYFKIQTYEEIRKDKKLLDESDTEF